MSVEFTKLSQPVIIATKGFPCTGKSEFARIIGQWVKCPVFYIDQFLDAVSLATGYSAELLPSPEQGERLHRLAFDALCKAASDSLQWGVDIDYWRYKCIVVKSRLCSTFELDRLLQLARECGCGTVLIIEFRMKNEYRSRLRLEHKVESRGHKQEWYKPRSWKDVEKANDDYDAHYWDLHLCRRLLDNKGDGLSRVTRLVLDPFDHLFLVPFAAISSRFQYIINFLLGGGSVEIGGYLREENSTGNIFVEGRYAVLHFGEVGRYLREKNLRGPRARRGPCYARGYLCVFKYWEELEEEDESNPDYCEVCEKHVISGQPAYGCQFCTMTLHKSCAERADVVTLEGYQDLNQQLREYPTRLPLRKLHACKSCLEGGKHFSHGCRSCYFHTHLKCGVLPTILNHDCHHHFLFMRFDNVYKCDACGIDRRRFRGCYYCYICDKSYDIECLSLAIQGEHEHGGNQHLLKLLYTREGMEEDESYWCDICYDDIDPQNWFYSCQECPYFSAHPNCARHSIGMGSFHTHPEAPR